MEILGIFRDVETAGEGVEGLVRAGFTEAQITSLTSVPYPDGVLVKTERRSWFRWVALAGGIAGACAGFALAAGTAWLYPVQTGDKPIIAFYPTGIVTFELTMLFAIIGTMAGMFLEMRLPPWGKRLYDPAIAEGCIGISVAIHAGGETVACGRGGAAGRVHRRHRLPLRRRAEEPGGGDHEGGRRPADHRGGDAMKRIARLAILAAAPLLMAALWMDEQPSYKPYEAPVLAPPVGERAGFRQGDRLAGGRAAKSRHPDRSNPWRRGKRSSTSIAPCATARPRQNRVRSARSSLRPRPASTMTWCRA